MLRSAARQLTACRHVQMAQQRAACKPTFTKSMLRVEQVVVTCSLRAFAICSAKVQQVGAELPCGKKAVPGRSRLRCSSTAAGSISGCMLAGFSRGSPVQRRYSRPVCQQGTNRVHSSRARALLPGPAR